MGKCRGLRSMELPVAGENKKNFKIFKTKKSLNEQTIS
jgi:hypothetical protein